MAGALLLGGCASFRSAHRYDQPGDRIIGEDFDYYPAHEAYFNVEDRVFVHREGSAWVRRAEPPPGWTAESPAVRVHFREGPEEGHAEVARRYPRTWRPPGPDDTLELGR